jgi:nucleotide-binding universal stress UspA family protein
MSTILVGVDDSERAQDAIAFTRELLRVSRARVVVATVFPYDDMPSRAANSDFRRLLEVEAERTAKRHAERLTGIDSSRIAVRSMARTSAAHGLQELAEQEGAGLIVVGSSHTGRRGRVLPGSTAERLLHGAPCPVAVVPLGYREGEHALRRIGAADDGSAESRAAVRAADLLARALGAELAVIRVQPDVTTIAAAPDAASAGLAVRDDLLRAARQELDTTVDLVDPGTRARGVLREGDPVRELADATGGLDVLITGSRGYGPLRAVLLGGVTGPLLREAHAPVVVVPRGVDAPLADLLAENPQRRGSRLRMEDGRGGRTVTT